eukprot:COSAG01_NODE_1722_length_9386_cov_6.717562_9_plen_123_part_00
MLLVMPTFDQAAKDKELAALLQTITTVMSDGIVLTKRKFDDAALTQARPSSNPKLRQEIAQLQRTSAALRIQASMRVRRDAQAVRAVRGRPRERESPAGDAAGLSTHDTGAGGDHGIDHNKN